MLRENGKFYMPRKLSSGVFEASDIAVYHALASHADDTGKSWPSISTICREAHLTERTVRKSMKRLAEQKLLCVSKRGPTSSLYTMPLQVQQPKVVNQPLLDLEESVILPDKKGLFYQSTEGHFASQDRQNNTTNEYHGTSTMEREPKKESTRATRVCRDKPDARIHILQEHFLDRMERKNGSKPVAFPFGESGKHIKLALSQGMAETQYTAIIDRYFDVKRKTYKWKYFESDFEDIRAEVTEHGRKTVGKPERELTEDDGAAYWKEQRRRELVQLHEEAAGHVPRRVPNGT